jgi:PilZ domain
VPPWLTKREPALKYSGHSIQLPVIFAVLSGTENQKRYFGLATMIEKRATLRHRVLKHGTLAFGGGGGVECTVRNISSGGARLDVSNPIALPGSFTLVIQNDQFMRRCHPVWVSEQRVGVAFD